MVFLDRIQQSDTDLVVRLDVLTEELRRKEADLARLKAEQERIEADFERQALIFYAAVNEAQAIRDQYAAQYASEQRALAFLVTGTAQIFPGSALQACPAPGSYFTDTWGAPRSGGRYHQGVDMMAPYGHPVLAAQTGNVSYGSSSLGGLQAYVYGDSGDVTYYAHLQAFVGGARHVQAGEQIGEVGDTGNATGTPHLHFEYHPGGGSAVNPTPYVAAVC
jgi:murein DD-endopeptidase MepM/ murein hydrolase activator NlpD